MRQAMEEAGKKERLDRRYENKDMEQVSSNFRDYDQSQMFFITVSKEGFIVDRHPVVIIDNIIERLDLSSLYNQYSDEGKPAYHPKMMLTYLTFLFLLNLETASKVSPEPNNTSVPGKGTTLTLPSRISGTKE